MGAVADGVSGPVALSGRGRADVARPADPVVIRQMLLELVEAGRLKALLDDISAFIGVSLAVVDLEGQVLAASRWQRLCTEFHHEHSGCRPRCIESDTSLAGRVEQGSAFNRYRCRNGLTDCASPIVIDQVHVANFFVGQFLEAPPDTAFFKRQTQELGFPREAYLEALAEVPVVPESRLPAILNLLVHFKAFLVALVQERLHERHGRVMARLGRIIESSLNEIYVFDAATLRFVTVNQGARQNLGYALADLEEMTPLSIKPEMTPERFQQILSPLREGVRDTVRFETVHQRKDGSSYPVEVHVQLMADEAPAVFVAYIQDITERKHLEELLHRQASTDDLTGIANRRQFMQAAETEVSRVERYGGTLALLMLDLDRFKGINDRLGHKAGDETLRHFAEGVKAALRESDLFARVGGEEFMVLLPETGLAGAQELAERLRRDIAAATVATDRGPVRYTVSIGVTVIVPPGADFERALSRADEALYQAKRSGRNRVECKLA